jgi:hypothetical protein
MEAVSQGTRFEKTVNVLYGIHGIGKSRFAVVLAYELMRRYNLNIPAVYFLQCEGINHDWMIRHDYIATWPAFVDFIDGAEARTEFQKTVKLYVIDTLDGLYPKGIDKICDDYHVIDPRDEGWAGVWREFNRDLEHQLMRLSKLGGVLILSHERKRSATFGRMVIERPSMDLPDSTHGTVSNLVSMCLHMRKSGSDDGSRVLASLGNKAEDCKDNLNKILPKYEDGIIPFETEEQAVEKLLSCFDEGKGGVVKHKKVKKVKKSKKIKKKKAKRR